MPTTTTQTAVAIPTGTWAVDPKHSSVGFSVKHLGIASVRGRFTDFTGTLTVHEDGRLNASGTVEVASVNTNDEDRDNHLRSADFFDAESYPQITFESRMISEVDDDEFVITGDLTIHGVTRQVALEAEVIGTESDPWGNDRVGLEARTEISRSDYDIKFDKALGSGNALVGDKVKITLDISAVRQS